MSSQRSRTNSGHGVSTFNFLTSWDVPDALASRWIRDVRACASMVKDHRGRRFVIAHRKSDGMITVSVTIRT